MYEVDMTNTGNLISELRKKKGLTQGALAKLIDASTQAVSKWERGNGFPEIYYQHKLCDLFNISLDELHSGKINYKLRKKKLIIKIYQIVISLIIISIIPFFIYYLCFYIKNHNSLKYYNLTISSSETFYVYGMAVEDADSYTLYFGNISFFNYELKNTDIITINLYNKDKLIYSIYDLNQYIKILNKKLINIKKMNIEVIVTNVDQSKVSYKSALKFNNADNNIIDANKNNINTFSDLDNEQIEKNLIANDFIKINDETWLKKIINNKIEEYIYYYPNQDRIMFVENSPIKVITINYKYLENNIAANIYDTNNDIQVLREKYKYNYNDKRIDCEIGRCLSIDDILKKADKYKNLLFVEFDSTKK